MSELFDDDDPVEPEPMRPSRRMRALIITVFVLVVAFFLLTAFASIYTDRLWYQEVGYGQVFSKLLWTKVGLFAAFGVVMAATVAVNMVLAYRFRPLFWSGSDPSVERYREAVTPIRSWLLAGVALVVGGFAGTSAMGQWRTYLLWRHSQPFGRTDHYFGKDIGFYVFELPWWHYLVDFVMAVAVVTLIATAVVHYLYGGIRLQVRHDRLSGAAQVQTSVLLGVFVLAKSIDYFLDRYDLVTTGHSLFTGMNYTGEQAVLPARNILLGVALICAVLFFLNIWRRTWLLPSVGLALLALSSILLGMIWPAIVQGFQVKPSEADKEQSYIQANIDATREAYGLSGVDVESYPGTPSGTATAADLGPQLKDVPVVDPKQVRDTFEQLQQPRSYYSVAPVLDVDRYEIGGKEQPLVLGVREIDQEGINASDQNWSNLHTVYTHGEGIIAAYGNQVVGRAGGAQEGANGRMKWAEGLDDSGGVSSEDALGQFQDEIYYGEHSPNYSIVGKPSGEAGDVELGAPANGSEDTDTRTTYDGKGGVPIGSSFNRLMYAVKFGEPNFVLSGRVNANSKVLYDRSPVDRVEKVAPWLTLDSDPYPAVVDGHVEWIIDGYTTTDRYPDSERDSFAAMTDDSLQEDTGLQTVPTDEINYMRSAVKATVDAYDGTVKLYAWDESDPILQTWMAAFPGVVQPKAAIPDDLLEHLRYPEDLFKVQRYQLAKYHVTDADEFYQGSNRWEVPQDPNATSSMQPPYRMFLDENGTPVWSLSSVFVPKGKSNVASFVSVNSDATSGSFGKIRVLEMEDNNVHGPGTVATDMQANPGVSTALQSFRVSGASPPVMGNLLTVPVDGGLAYVQPVYAVRSGGSTASFRILQYVIVDYDDKVGIGANLHEALTDALGAGTGGTGSEGDEGGQGGQGGQGKDTGKGSGKGSGQGHGNGSGTPNGGAGRSLDARIDAALRRANEAFSAASQAQADGDLVTWAKKIKQAQKAVAEAVRLADRRDSQED